MKLIGKHKLSDGTLTIERCRNEGFGDRTEYEYVYTPDTLDKNVEFGADFDCLSELIDSLLTRLNR